MYGIWRNCNEKEIFLALVEIILVHYQFVIKQINQSYVFGNNRQKHLEWIHNWVFLVCVYVTM